MHNEEFLLLRDMSIYTKRFGNGIPLVFLHGGPGGEHRYFLPHLQSLDSHFELIFYDQRGCGQSARLQGGDYTIEDEIETLEELRKSLGLEKLNLVGESWGSMLALLYASKYPQHTNKIFMTAAVGATVDGYLGFGEELEKRLTSEDRRKFDELVKKLEVNEVDVAEIFKVINPYYVYSVSKLAKKTETNSNAEVNSRLGEDIKSKYNHLIDSEALGQVPMMIAQGDTDIITPEALEELLLKHLPHARLVEIKNCGHWSVIEQPEVLKNLIKEFFLGE
ncbi:MULTISPECIES: alpha/beta fold hydrolase [unclassified Bacillus (in: firmicutes)]|uniref:alpha/beta fold hydrolase n=1 Tax=unclassified Bacillus (in: firmicutes) TaxID=185979 RepID=UPI0008F11B4B|nr:MULTISPECIES: alpha/beta fold hydrolase [unclassified Bacillus (in: firmicutes)]SFA77963.1 proline iminopeptidase [Bacillus sp. UNCCL13]SFQ67847.1 proline iminopeptidase [Bacillus sp. cl95]